MRFVKDGKAFTLTDIRRAHPEVSFPRSAEFDPSDLGYLPLVESEKPEGDVVEESAPVLIGESWHAQWTARDFTNEERASRVPQEVDMCQARLALLNAGLLSHVEQAMSQYPESARTQWEYRTTVRRNSDLVQAMGQGLGLTSAQIDALFEAAASL